MGVNWNVPARGTAGGPGGYADIINAILEEIDQFLALRDLPGGYAGVGPDGKIANSLIGLVMGTDVYVVASQAAMLGLSQATPGDVAVRTDPESSGGQQSYILTATPASTLGNWAVFTDGVIASVLSRLAEVEAATPNLAIRKYNSTVQDERVNDHPTSGTVIPELSVPNFYHSTDVLVELTAQVENTAANQPSVLAIRKDGVEIARGAISAGAANIPANLQVRAYVPGPLAHDLDVVLLSGNPGDTYTAKYPAYANLLGTPGEGGASDDFWWTPDHAAFSGTDYSVQVLHQPFDYTPSAARIIVGKWHEATNNREWNLSQGISTGPTFSHTAAGTAPPLTPSFPAAPALPHVDGQPTWIRVDRLPELGVYDMYYILPTGHLFYEGWPENDDWDYYTRVAPASGGNAGVGIFAGAAPLVIGAKNTGATITEPPGTTTDSASLYRGRIFAMRLYVDGVLVACPDFRNKGDVASFTDDCGRLWTRKKATSSIVPAVAGKLAKLKEAVLTVESAARPSNLRTQELIGVDTLNSTNLAYSRTMIRRGQATIAILGDSLVAGTGAYSRDNTWPLLFLKALRDRYQPAGIKGGLGWFNGYPFGADAVQYVTPWIDYDGLEQYKPGQPNNPGFNGQADELDATGEKKEALLHATSVRIYYQRFPGGGTFNWSYDGGATTLINTDGTLGTQYFTISGLVDNEYDPTRLKIEWASGQVRIEGGFVFRGDENTGIRIAPSGHSAYGAFGYAQSLAWSQTLATFPDLAMVVVPMGINDMKANPPRTQAEYRADMETIVNQIRTVNANVDIVFWNQYNAYTVTAGPTYTLDDWTPYEAVLVDMVADDPKLTLFDAGARIGDVPIGPYPAAADVYLDPNYYWWDSTHPNIWGYLLLADAFSKFVMG